MLGTGLFDRLVRRVAKVDAEVQSLPNGLERLRELTSRLVAAEEEAQLFSKALEQLRDAVVLTKDNLIHYVNSSFCDMYGYSKEEIIGQQPIALFAGTPGEHAELGKQFKQVFHQPNGLARLEYQDKRKDGSVFWVATTTGIVNTSQGLYWVSTLRDVTTRKQAEEQLQRQSAMLAGINKVLMSAAVHGDIVETARICLAVAEELTDSKFGFIGMLNEAGLFDDVAISDPGWDACKMPDSDAVQLIQNMQIRGVDRSTLRDKESRIVNDPASHPDHIEPPKGHPRITSFLGVPLKRAGETIGMIGLANNETGYEQTDKETIETLSVAFVEALMFTQK